MLYMGGLDGLMRSRRFGRHTCQALIWCFFIFGVFTGVHACWLCAGRPLHALLLTGRLLLPCMQQVSGSRSKGLGRGSWLNKSLHVLLLFLALQAVCSSPIGRTTRCAPDPEDTAKAARSHFRV